MLCNSIIHFVQQFTAEISAHIEFKIFAYSRRRINEKHINNMILNEISFMFVLMSIFRSYVFNDNDEMIHRHKMLNSLNDRKFKFLSQFNLYVLKKSLNFANKRKARINKSTNKIKKFEYFRKNFINFESTFSISVEVYSFLKHNIHERFFFTGTAAAHDIFHEMFCCFFIVRHDFRIFSFVFILSRQDIINKNSK